jgi:hypothetical protein
MNFEIIRYSEGNFMYTFVGRYFDGRQWLTVDGNCPHPYSCSSKTYLILVCKGKTVAASGYVGWRAGEPNHVQQSLEDGTLVNEACGVVNWDGEHNDVACGWKHPYICEFIHRPCTKP